MKDESVGVGRGDERGRRKYEVRLDSEVTEWEGRTWWLGSFRGLVCSGQANSDQGGDLHKGETRVSDRYFGDGYGFVQRETDDAKASRPNMAKLRTW